MGNQNSSSNKSDKPKINKNHHRTKSFSIGLLFGKGMSSVEGHAQIGYASHSKKDMEKMHLIKKKKTSRKKMQQKVFLKTTNKSYKKIGVFDVCP